MKLHWAFRQMQVVQRLEQSKADERCRKRKAVIKWHKSCADQGVWNFMNRQWRFGIQKGNSQKHGGRMGAWDKIGQGDLWGD